MRVFRVELEPAQCHSNSLAFRVVLNGNHSQPCIYKLMQQLLKFTNATGTERSVVRKRSMVVYMTNQFSHDRAAAQQHLTGVLDRIVATSIRTHGKYGNRKVTRKMLLDLHYNRYNKRGRRHVAVA